jgi:hypothetical protein
MKNRWIGAIFILLVGVGAGVGVDRWFSTGRTITALPVGSVRAKPGPWGELYSIPFTIAAPDEALPIRTFEAGGTHWFFKNLGFDQLRSLLQAEDLSVSQREALLDPGVLNVTAGGIDLKPPFDVLLALSPKARSSIYRYLSQFSENNPEIHFINKATLEDRFAGSKVSSQTLALFRKLSCEYGDYLVFSGLSAMLGELPSYDEKLHFFKALTRQKTMLFRLRVGPDSDLVGLQSYWGRGGASTDVKTILESVSKIEGGTYVNILMLLPPLPTSELYTYPTIPDNPLNGQATIRDCHWTSFNFFRDVPDPRASGPDYYIQQLKTNYAPAIGDPRYGDLVLFSKPDGTIIHSAVYLADDVAFTKNGGTVINPWMLATIDSLLKQYSFQVAPDQKLTVSYYRNKML